MISLFSFPRIYTVLTTALLIPLLSSAQVAAPGKTTAQPKSDTPVVEVEMQVIQKTPSGGKDVLTAPRFSARSGQSAEIAIGKDEELVLPDQGSDSQQKFFTGVKAQVTAFVEKDR